MLLSSINYGSFLNIDWQAVSAILEFIGVVILLYGFNLVRLEISSRKQERSMRKFETLVSLNESFLNDTFWEQIRYVSEDKDIDWENFDNDLIGVIVISSLSKFSLIQGLIDEDILDVLDLFTIYAKPLIDFAKAMNNFILILEEIKGISIVLKFKNNHKLGLDFLNNILIIEKSYTEYLE